MTPGVDIRSADFLYRPVECLGALWDIGATCPVDPDGGVLVTRHDLVRRILQDTAGFPIVGSKHQAPPPEAAEVRRAAQDRTRIRGPLETRATVHRRAGW